MNENTCIVGVLTCASGKPRLSAMKKHVVDLPLKTVIGAAQKATRQAAVDAVAAGRKVAGWRNGSVVEYGPDALPLAPTKREEEDASVRAA